MMEIVSINEKPKLAEVLVDYVSQKWPQVKDHVIPVIRKSCSTKETLPKSFVLLKNNKIIGFYQLQEQELLIRKDLSPWISPIFIDEAERGLSYGALLLEHGRQTAGSLGYEKVYLTTDHIQYYEKYGFREIGLSMFEWGRPSKIYEHDTIK